MDGQKSPAKLTRTNSSFLRSSPTIRSSIHSLSSVSEISPDEQTLDLEEQKPHINTTPAPVRPDSACLAPVMAVLLVVVYTLFAFFTRDDMSTSENFLCALVFVAVVLFIVLKNMALVSKNFVLCKHLWGEYVKKLGFPCFTPKTHSKPVQWLIGESSSGEMGRREDGGVDKIVSEGMEVYSNGNIYEGEFHQGRCNGSGVYNYFGNGRYEGDWVDGKYDGYGIEIWAGGSRYRGQYRQGLRHGYGVYKFYTGDTYAGEWCKGQSHGIGVQTCLDGSCYIGEFKCGVKHGLGCYHFRNGDRYAGEYFGDKVHGFGVYHFANGHYYEGSWHEGHKQGYGMYTFQNGESRCGEWHRGILKAHLPPLSDAVLRPVQAARKAADNATHIRRVNEQVDTAMSAANRAATGARVAAIKAVQKRIDSQFCNTNI